MNPFADSHVPGKPTKLGWHTLITVSVSALLLAVACIPFLNRGGPTPFAIPVLGVGIMGANLAGFWTAFGRGWFRFPIVVLYIAAAALLLSWSTGGRELQQFAYFISGITICVGVTGAVLRQFFGQLRQIRPGDFAPDGLQFDLRHLFILTTVVAVFIGVFQWLRGIQAIVGMNAFVIISVLVAVISVTSVVAIWAIFGRHLTITRIVVLLLVVIGACTCVTFALPAPSFFWSLIIAFEQALTVSALFCVRFQGYRFVKQNVGSGAIEGV